MRVRSRGTLILIILVAMTAIAMLLPIAIGFSLREHRAARAFLYSALLLVSFAGLVFLANRGERVGEGRFSHPFYVLTAAYLGLPVIMAIPLTEAVPNMGLFHAWFEMTASFTTTGATLLDDTAPLSVHLWRAVVGWAGGAFVLIYALAILAPLNLGGFEVLTTGANAAQSDALGKDDLPTIQSSARDPQAPDIVLADLAAALRVVGAVYAGLTLLLWVGLSLTGLPPLRGLVLSMSTLATSGIVVPGGEGAPGFAAELLIALMLVTGLSRIFWTDLGRQSGTRAQWWRTELGLAGVVLAAVVFAAFTGAVLRGRMPGIEYLPPELWATTFTALSFLTTTGFTSTLGTEGTGWLAGSSGVILLCLAALGGGVATTAGGIKLMRLYALFSQVSHEMGQLVHPSRMGGDGPARRALRREGAFAAWLYVMIFVFALACVVALLAAIGHGLEASLRLALAALTTTGPLAQTGAGRLDVPAWGDLGWFEQALLAAAMIIGRLDFLLLLSIFWPRR